MISSPESRFGFDYVIKLFVARSAGARHGGAKIETMQGFYICHWSEEGLEFSAVSDINAAELDEFGKKFIAALHT